MLSEEEALARILRSVKPLSSRRVKLERALHCFAATDVFAGFPSPGFDNSAMDGYAVIAGSCAPGAKLKVVGEQPAGVDRQLSVAEGEAVRIFTGAPIPRGADAVVMQEDVVRQKNEIEVNTRVLAGEFIRRRGLDVAEGQKIIEAGSRMTSAKLALLASQGIADFAVGGIARVAILSTGDEIVPPGEERRAGEIFESNGILLRTLAEASGARLESVRHVTDDSAALESAIRQASGWDALIITGGVSVGARDFVKGALSSAGAEIDLWRVAIKPGKPFLFGTRDGAAIFALPGNPVSAFVTFLIFVRPALLKLMGAAMNELSLAESFAELTIDLRNDGERVHYVRGKAERGKFTPMGLQESHALFGLSQANALLRLGLNAQHRRGEIVAVKLLG